MKQCAYCSRTDDLTIDHIVPFWNGGDNSSGNKQILCKTCHEFKNMFERLLQKDAGFIRKRKQGTHRHGRNLTKGFVFPKSRGTSG